MKNLDLLKTGGKPAPGRLVIIQGFVNTLDIEVGVDEIGTRELLKAWLVRHGLSRSSARVSSVDFRTAIFLRNALRSLLLANNGVTVPPSMLKQLNQLLSQLPLAASFDTNGMLSFIPAIQGMAGVFGKMLSLVVQAINDGTWFRLKACSEPKCQWVFYDGSKNHSGRWCSMSVCGSRYKARAYRRRHPVKERNPGSRRKSSNR